MTQSRQENEARTPGLHVEISGFHLNSKGVWQSCRPSCSACVCPPRSLGPRQEAGPPSGSWYLGSGGRVGSPLTQLGRVPALGKHKAVVKGGGKTNQIKKYILVHKTAARQGDKEVTKMSGPGRNWGRGAPGKDGSWRKL